MRRFWLVIFLSASCLTIAAPEVWSAGLSDSESRFVYKDRGGKVMSARIIARYWLKPIVHPFADIDPRLNPKLIRAATIAEERANARSQLRCWHYVKEALLAAGVIRSYPKTAYAAEAGEELMRDYGFRRLRVRNPYAAPVGAVLVYGTKQGGGHIEIRTHEGFVSDYYSKTACLYPLVAVYGKFSS